MPRKKKEEQKDEWEELLKQVEESEDGRKSKAQQIKEERDATLELGRSLGAVSRSNRQLIQWLREQARIEGKSLPQFLEEVISFYYQAKSLEDMPASQFIVIYNMAWQHFTTYLNKVIDIVTGVIPVMIENVQGLLEGIGRSVRERVEEEYMEKLEKIKKEYEEKLKKEEEPEKEIMRELFRDIAPMIGQVMGSVLRTVMSTMQRFQAFIPMPSIASASAPQPQQTSSSQPGIIEEIKPGKDFKIE